jgi:hypothetical protein
MKLQPVKQHTIVLDPTPSSDFSFADYELKVACNLEETQNTGLICSETPCLINHPYGHKQDGPSIKDSR